MKYLTGYIAGKIAVNWSVRSISMGFGVNSVIARMYLQPCTNPAQVQSIIDCLVAIDRSTN